MDYLISFAVGYAALLGITFAWWYVTEHEINSWVGWVIWFIIGAPIGTALLVIGAVNFLLLGALLIAVAEGAPIVLAIIAIPTLIVGGQVVFFTVQHWRELWRERQKVQQKRIIL